MRAVRASAPGSLMLMGEHSVLRGAPALVCAIRRRINVSLTPRGDDLVKLHSSLGTHETPLDELASDEGFRFVMGAIRAMREQLDGGFELDIRSEMSHQMGLGSSAAVTVATLGALSAATGGEADPRTIAELGVGVVRKAQGGRGSGADVAASAHGGVLRYFMESREALKLPIAPELTLLYSGYKTPTAEVIAFVEGLRQRAAGLYEKLDALVGELVQEAVEGAVRGDLGRIGQLMNMNQGLMDAMGVNDAMLSKLVYQLRDDPQILGSKISGSGLGDCAVGLGRAMRREFGCVSMDVEVDPRGVKCEVVE